MTDSEFAEEQLKLGELPCNRESAQTMADTRTKVKGRFPVIYPRIGEGYFLAKGPNEKVLEVIYYD